MSFDNQRAERSPIFEQVQIVDIIVLLSVPAVLGLVFLTPVQLRQSLAFEYADPSLVPAFASAYVHLEAGHLLANVGTYCLVVPIAYGLSVASGDRRRFYTAFVTFLVVFPLVLSYMNLAVVRSAVTYGFSGVAMAFVGYLPLSLASYLEARFDIGPGMSIAPAIFFLTVGLIVALSLQSVVPENATVMLGAAGLVAVAVLSALLYALAAYDRGDDFGEKLRATVTVTGEFELFVLAVVVIFAFPAVAFPADPTTGGGGHLNLYAHLLGYALGFIVTYTTVEVSGRFDLAAA